MIEDGCPIPNTHRRVEQAHVLWHQALGAYHDPDLFQTNLNALVEALRNVTFMLQSEKGRIPGFDEWYEVWRAQMKADPLMRWLVEARNEIVKRADLEIASTAFAVIHNNVTQATVTRDVPPWQSTEEIAASLAASAPKRFETEAKRLVLRVERQWRLSELGQRELLDALAHAFGVLSVLVRDAHALCGHDLPPIDHDGRPIARNDGQLPCMRVGVRERTLSVRLGDGMPLIPQSVRVPFDPAVIPDLIQRYGPPDDFPRTDDPIEFAEAIVPFAKRVLVKDGGHSRFVHLHTSEGWGLVSIEAEDRTAKYILMRHLAEEVDARNADAIVEIGEVWNAPSDEILGGLMPEDAPSRREALVVSVTTRKGLHRAYHTLFSRDSEGGIVLGETQVQELPMPAYLAPVCKVWGLPDPEPGL